MPAVRFPRLKGAIVPCLQTGTTLCTNTIGDTIISPVVSPGGGAYQTSTTKIFFQAYPQLVSPTFCGLATSDVTLTIFSRIRVTPLWFAALTDHFAFGGWLIFTNPEQSPDYLRPLKFVINVTFSKSLFLEADLYRAFHRKSYYHCDPFGICGYTLPWSIDLQLFKFISRVVYCWWFKFRC